MITHSQEFPVGREHAAYEAFVAAVRQYAHATHHNDLITWQSVAERAGLTYRLEVARLDDHHRGSAA